MPQFEEWEQGRELALALQPALQPGQLRQVEGELESVLVVSVLQQPQGLLELQLEGMESQGSNFPENCRARR